MLAITFGTQLVALIAGSTDATSYIVPVSRIVGRVHLRFSSLPACLQVTILFIFALSKVAGMAYRETVLSASRV